MSSTKEPAARRRSRARKGALALLPIAAMTLSVGVTLPAAAATSEAPTSLSAFMESEAAVALGAALAPSALAASAAQNASGDGFAAAFATPSMEDKPKMRWWVPNALMTEEEISHEIESMVDAGFGGAEAVSFAVEDPAGEDVAWGSERWKKLTKHMLEAAAPYGFSIDFTLTAGWPLNLPTITDLDDPAQGAQKEADSAHVDGITQDAPFSGAIPVPELRDTAGTPTLAAVTVAKYADKEARTLDYASARSLDLDDVRYADREADPTNATIDFVPGDDGEYVLFGWWEYPSGNKAHGNYEIDHFGTVGAQSLIDFWEDELIPAYGDAWSSVGALYSDSLEFATHLDWTDGLLDSFEKAKGYDLRPYLPALYQASAAGDYSGDPVPDFAFDAHSEQIRNDYFDVMTKLYVENHLEPLQKFAHDHGVDLRVQPAYGKNLNTPASALAVDIPETESLYGSDIIDFYRLQAGAVHLGDKKTYSIETAPEQHIKIDMGEFVYDVPRGNGETDAWTNQQTMRDMRWHIQRAFAGGVNQIVFHGYPYNGQYDGASAENGFAQGAVWPGWQSMDFSNSWGERSPNWQHMADSTAWIARSQRVLREGEAKIDLAIYSLKYWEDIDFLGRTKDYDDHGALEKQGYSYDFVDPSGFALDDAVVDEQRLDLGGPAYKAIIVDSEQTMPGETVDRFQQYADAGLPILFVGDRPVADAYDSRRDISTDISALLEAESVLWVGSRDEVPAALGDLGVAPDAAYSEPSTLLSNHRSTDDAEFYRLYNYGEASTWPEAKEMADVETTVTLQGDGRPYLLDAWTGDIMPIAEYTRGNAAVTLDVEVGANDSTIIALADDGWAGQPATDVYIPNTDATVGYDDVGGRVAKSATGGKSTITTDAGDEIAVDFGAVPDAPKLSAWDLTVESWTKGDTPAQSAKSTIEVGEVDALAPWNEIPGLETVSGIGTYTATYNLDEGWKDGVGASLDLGAVNDTYRIAVNGETISANQNDPAIDIGEFLVAGSNEITVEVASTLFNAWIAETSMDKQQSQYGLLGPVELVPYRWTQVTDGASDDGSDGADDGTADGGAGGGSDAGSDDGQTDADQQTGADADDADKDDLAVTGGQVIIGAIVLAIVLLAGGALFVSRRRKTPIDEGVIN
ncbi:glycosyl hydrolase [Microbacterium sp.]|uniref:glycosyl hydrolase n=1 Tax=Microbacterium sp. TaxID=51671 RepID=UPI00260EF61E|nr:glycosyl hydrolase [Microbacterium sp.]